MTHPPSRHVRCTLLPLSLLLVLVPLGATAEPKPAASPGYAWLDQVQWMDAPAPTKEHLRRHVVVVEFWAADCINCRRTAPAMRELVATFKDSAVVVLGVHTPELEDERSADTVRRVMKETGITWAVGRDNDYDAWHAFHNEYWPALYVLDGKGNVRAQHIGELHVGTPAWTSLLSTISSLRRQQP